MGSGNWSGWVRAAGRAGRRWSVLGVGIATAAGLAACGSGSTVSSAKVGRITVDHSGSVYHYHAQGVSGSVSGGSAPVGVPSGFPSAVPLPSGGVLVDAATTQGASGAGFNLIYRYPSATTASKALGVYDAELRSAGFANNSSSSGSGTVLQGWTATHWGVSITVGPTGSSPASEMMLDVSALG